MFGENKSNNNNLFIVYKNSAGHRLVDTIDELFDTKFKRSFLSEADASTSKRKSSANRQSKELQKLQQKIEAFNRKLMQDLQKVLDENVIKLLALSIKGAKDLTQLADSLKFKIKKDVIILVGSKKIAIPVTAVDKKGEQHQMTFLVDNKLFNESVALYSKLYLKAFRKLAIVGSIRQKLQSIQQSLTESDNNQSASNTNKALKLLIDKSPLIYKLYADKERRIKLIAAMAYTSALTTHTVLLNGEAARLAGNGNVISLEQAKKKALQITSAYKSLVKKYNGLLYKHLQRIEKGENKLRKELQKLKKQLDQLAEIYNKPNNKTSQSANSESLQITLEASQYSLQDKYLLQAYKIAEVYLTEGLIDLIKNALLKIGKAAFIVGLKIGMIIGWFVDGTLYLIAPFRRALSPIVKPVERARQFIEQSISKGITSAMLSYGIPETIAIQISNAVSSFALGAIGTVISGIPLPAAAKLIVGSYGAIYGTYKILTEYAEMTLQLKKKADVAAVVDNLRQTWEELQALVDSLIMPDALDEEIESTISS